MSDMLDNMTADQLRAEVCRLREEAGELAQQKQEAERQSEQLRILAARLTHLENRERRQLALLLHDHLQQLLVGSRMKLGLLKQQVATPQAASSLAEAAALIDQSIILSRSLSADLSPSILYEAGLNAGMQWLAEQMESKHGLHVDIDVDDEPEDQDIRVFLFQCVRELMSNVVRHANIKSAHVRIHPLDENLIQIKVSDNGIGFNPEMISSMWATGDSFGLHNIKARLTLLGGTMSVVSEPGAGTTVTLIAPLRGSHLQPGESPP